MDTLFTQLEAFIKETMDTHHIPGAVVGVWQDGETQIMPFGVTSIENPLPVTADTLFQVGSITKTFTALLVMQLVEQGKLDLDATVQSYLPDFRVANIDSSTRATIRHLLTHTAGWVGDLFEDTGEGDDALSQYVALMAELEQLAPLGEVYSYNNASFYLLGAVLEAVDGRFYQTILHENILQPLGMSRSYLKSWDAMTRRFAVGHQMDAEGNAAVARPYHLPRAVHPVGGLITTVPDLLRYAQFQMTDAVAQQLHIPQVQIWGEGEAIGLSWFIDDIDGVRVLSHGGGVKGQISRLFIVPERNFAAAIVTNWEDGGLLTHPTARWLLRELLGLDAPEPQAIEADVTVFKEYVGLYKRPYADIELFMDNNQLMMQLHNKQGFPSRNDPPPPNPPPAPLALLETDRLLVMDGVMKNGRIDIIRRKDGSIGWVRDGRLHHKVNIPNQETIDSIQESLEPEKLVGFDDINDLFEDLDI